MTGNVYVYVESIVQRQCMGLSSIRSASCSPSTTSTPEDLRELQNGSRDVDDDVNNCDNDLFF